MIVNVRRIDIHVLITLRISIFIVRHLRRRHALEGGRNLLLPWQAHLGVDLGRGLEVLDTLVEQAGAEDNVVGAESLLCVVHVGGAVLAVVAVDILAYHNISMGRFDGLICDVDMCRRTERLTVRGE